MAETRGGDGLQALREVAEAISMPRSEARELTERIRRKVADYEQRQSELSSVWSEMASLISQAESRGAWLALGYQSWTAYVAAEFAGSGAHLDRESRDALITDLASRGMSTRAIEPVVGASREEVRRTINRSVDTSVSTEPVASDDPNGAPPARRITGQDGKTYSARPRNPPKRRPLPDAARSAVVDFEKALSKLRRIVEDDRLPANREKVAVHLHGRLTSALEIAIPRLLERLTETGAQPDPQQDKKAIQ